MFFLPSLPIDFNRVSSMLRVFKILSLNDLAFPASYKKPVFSSIIVSLEPPMLLAIIGFSIDCASTATLPKASGSVEAETIIDEKTGFLFEAGNAKSLSQKFLKILNLDETSLKSIGIEGRKNVIQKFNVEKMCFSTYSEYKRLLN